MGSKLFCTEDGSPITFHFPHTGSEREKLSHMITSHGGLLVRAVTDYTIHLSWESHCINPNDLEVVDLFSRLYVDDCVQANALLDLNTYRLNDKLGKYVTYNANEVMLQKQKWKDIIMTIMSQTLPDSATRPFVNNVPNCSDTDYVDLIDDVVNSVNDIVDASLLLNQAPLNSEMNSSQVGMELSVNSIQDVNHLSLNSFQEMESPTTSEMLNELQNSVNSIVPHPSIVSTDIEFIDLDGDDTEVIRSVPGESIVMGVMLNQVPLNSEMDSTLVGTELSASASQDSNLIVHDTNHSLPNSFQVMESQTATPILNEITSSSVSTDIECIDLDDDDDNEVISSVPGVSMVTRTVPTKQGIGTDTGDVTRVGIRNRNASRRSVLYRLVEAKTIMDYILQDEGHLNPQDDEYWIHMAQNDMFTCHDWTRLKKTFETRILPIIKTYDKCPDIRLRQYYLSIRNKLIEKCRSVTIKLNDTANSVECIDLESENSENEVPMMEVTPTQTLERQRNTEPRNVFNDVDITHNSSDKHILEFVFKNGSYGDNDGVAIWKWLETTGIVPGQDWKTLKLRFQTFILLNMKIYKLNPQMTNFFKMVRLCLLGGKQLQVVLGNSSVPALNEIDKCYNLDLTYYNNGDRRNDMIILNFLFINGSYSDIEGDAIWKWLESTNLIEDSEWQQLKDKFKSVILPKIKSYKLPPSMQYFFNMVQRCDVGRLRLCKLIGNNTPPRFVDDITATKEENDVTNAIKESVERVAEKKGTELAITDEMEVAETITTALLPLHKNVTASSKPSYRNPRCSYTLQEDKMILNYLYKNDFYSKVADKFWKQMELQNVLPNRPRTSIRNRFYTIMKRIKKYSLPKEMHHYFFRNISLYHDFSGHDSGTESVESGIEIGTEESMDVQEEELTTKDPILTDEEPSNESETNQDQNITCEPPFELSEDVMIIKYICRQIQFRHIDDDNMWRNMVEDKIVPGHTFISLKRHFKEVIMNKIEEYEIPCEYNFFLDYFTKKDSISTHEERRTESGTNQDQNITAKYEPPFEVWDDLSIMKYLYHKKQLNPNIEDNVWKAMVEENVVPGRTFVSLKQHFQDVIVNKIRECQAKRKTPMNVTKMDLISTREQPATESATNQDVTSKYGTPFELSEEINIMNYICRQPQIRDIDDDNLWRNMEKIVPGRSSISLKQHFKEVIMNKIEEYEMPNLYKHFFMYVTKRDSISTHKEPATESETNQANLVSPSTPTYHYQPHEDICIMKYLCRQGRIHNINNESMWKKMVEENVVPGRTYASLRSHFKTVIMNHIDDYKVPDQVKQYFLKYVTKKGLYVKNFS